MREGERKEKRSGEPTRQDKANKCFSTCTAFALGVRQRHSFPQHSAPLHHILLTHHSHPSQFLPTNKNGSNLGSWRKTRKNCPPLKLLKIPSMFFPCSRIPVETCTWVMSVCIPSATALHDFEGWKVIKSCILLDGMRLVCPLKMLRDKIMLSPLIGLFRT